MDWWMWAISILLGTCVMAYLLWLIIPSLTVWYLRKKTIDYGINKANKLRDKILEDVE
jgi:ABC-type uncharacterized transport system permease subunit